MEENKNTVEVEPKKTGNLKLAVNVLARAILITGVAVVVNVFLNKNE